MKLVDMIHKNFFIEKAFKNKHSHLVIFKIKKALKGMCSV